MWGFTKSHCKDSALHLRNRVLPNVAARLLLQPIDKRMNSVLSRFSLCDAHCHPQDDPRHLELFLSVEASQVAAMGTRESNWQTVEDLYRAYPSKVIPCFGVHPWFAHAHALEPGTYGRDIIVDTRRHPAPSDQQGAEYDQQGCRGVEKGLLDSKLSNEWLQKLRQLLECYPQAWVGEFGLDRSAIIPQTKLQVSYQHQLQLTELHLRLAAELKRPVSMHCVRAYGHLHDMIKDLGPDNCPPRIMLHSFGGSPEVVVQFLRGLPKELGNRIFFSFSSVINGANKTKLISRITAVPDDRWLIESDQNTPAAIDSDMVDILAIVAEAKDWDLNRTAVQAALNFESFCNVSC
ncbi:hypothetical protein CEUSTIGMA_g2612.t1 [Chlamydomonas eustigma]|uniref:TatD related DNase n=1 Tax=Chlamydomonas eustigma TaxID=1157962 RepID=A0A250WWF3_9CHLO|nr:hypothetical protein CEUSTIGMA_g2612.t1 [Chlamydomonas eustigma]|eukprot:GAX75168.1 hypothetical protein CEUSTIGMA_g2612.t1 [Chlamydomonas eustigma]